jgi:hypothetical protein
MVNPILKPRALRRVRHGSSLRPIGRPLPVSADGHAAKATGLAADADFERNADWAPPELGPAAHAREELI